MSQFEATDLLCRSRREELSADEQRRLSESIARSLEVRLMSEILPELEEESRVRPGDELLLARINERALAAVSVLDAAGALSPFGVLGPSGALGVPGAHRPSGAHLKRPARRRALMLLVAAAVLLIGSLAFAWLGGARVFRRAPESPPASVKPTPTANPTPVAKLPITIIAPTAPPIQVTPVAPALPIASAAAHGPEPRAPTPGSASPSTAGPGAASELFTRANLLRRQGKNGEAAVLYELLLDSYPRAREVAPSRLALGKYLQAKQPERALAQYRAVVGLGGVLRAEALWGISEVATRLGEHAVSEQALADLLREFPDSPYAEVARARALHDQR